MGLKTGFEDLCRRPGSCGVLTLRSRCLGVSRLPRLARSRPKYW